MRKKIVSVIIFIIFNLFLFSVATVSLLIFFRFRFKGENENNVSHEYGYEEIPFNGNASNLIGLISMNKELGPTEYVSFVSENTGSLYIISNLGGDEYECTGSCYCQSNIHDNRKSAIGGTNALTQGIILFLSAFSILTATEIAKESFQNKCVNEFREECEPSNIKSRVSNCVVFDSLPERVDGEWVRFTCGGHCLPNAKVKSEAGKRAIKGFGVCKEFSVEAEVRIFCEQQLRKEPHFGVLCHNKAKREFAKQRLNEFCRRTSQVSFTYQYSYQKKGKQQKRFAAACVGTKNGRLVSNVHCKKIDY